MSFVAITATINRLKFDAVEKRLQELNVPGVSVSETKGYGDYKNFYEKNWMGPFARIQMYVKQQECDAVVEAILETAYSGTDSDGVVAVSPVTGLYKISEKCEIK